VTYRLSYAPHFLRRAEAFSRRHPRLQNRLAQLLLDLESDPFQAHLRLHALSGELEGLRAVSLTYRYRVLLSLDAGKGQIVLRDIGGHDELYR
jgi:mRNA interferase YafQ